MQGDGDVVAAVAGRGGGGIDNAAAEVVAAVEGRGRDAAAVAVVVGKGDNAAWKEQLAEPAASSRQTPPPFPRHHQSDWPAWLPD